jgi:hypothetical protein
MFRFQFCWILNRCGQLAEEGIAGILIFRSGRTDFLGNCCVISRRSGRRRPRVSMRFDRLLMIAIEFWEVNATGSNQNP